MSKMTPTLALILTGGLAAGIALARPGSAAPETTAPEPAVATAVDETPNRSGSNRSVARGGESTESDAQPAGGSAAAPSNDPAPTGGPATVTIEGFAFDVGGPVGAGQTITVVNQDGAPHTLTFEDGAVDTGTIDGGQSIDIVAPEAGSYRFFCQIHPSMTGELVVG